MSNIRKGDEVIVLAGKDKGKRGTVLLVNATKGQVVVEGGRTVQKASKPTEAEPTGGIKTVDAPVHISNVKKVG